MSAKNTEFLYFCFEMQGWDMINMYNIVVPKYLLFWKGYNANDLLSDNTIYNKRERINKSIN